MKDDRGPMRIGLNILPVVPGIGGTWNYVAGLTSALAEHDRENEYVVFCTGANTSLVPTRPNFTRVEVALRASSRPLRVVFENTVFRFFLANQRLACVHHLFGTLPFAGSLPTVVTVHDLMVFARPWEFPLVKRNYLRLMGRRVASRASVLAPVSRATAEHLHQQFGVSMSRMEILPASIGPEFTDETPEAVAAFRSRYGLPARFWLHVAESYPHKNHYRLVAAFAELRRGKPDGWTLVMRGDATEALCRVIAEHGVSDRVTFLPRLPEGEMPLLYSAASALVSPSLFEGGGLPVMEAMACGCPVVASDIPTTREFAPAAAVTFDPSSVPAMADAMARCEDSPTLRAELRAAGFRAAAALQSSRLAAGCLAAYARAVSESSVSNGRRSH